MQTISSLQNLRVHNLTPPASVTGGNSTNSQFDASNGGPLRIRFNLGALGAAGITALSVHASDTSGFSPGAGNLVASFTGASLPADANDNGIWIVDVPNPARYGRYWNVIITAGANACLVSASIDQIALESPTTATEAGAVQWTVVEG